MNKINLLKCEKNVNLNQHVISCLSGNPAECKSLLNIMPLDSRVKPENDKEVGRSMVEMLGVLAVMGVLSVAGIAGYNTAMQSYRTNEILNATSMFYVLAMSQNQGNGPSGKITYSAIGGTNPSGVSSLEYENNAITITFNDAKDCTMAKNKLGDKASGECPTLTVSFGEIAEEEASLPEIDSEVAACISERPGAFQDIKTHGYTTDDIKDCLKTHSCICCDCIFDFENGPGAAACLTAEFC